MSKNYKVNNIFNENGKTLNDLISEIFTSFLDDDFTLFDKDVIINKDISLKLIDWRLYE